MESRIVVLGRRPAFTGAVPFLDVRTELAIASERNQSVDIAGLNFGADLQGKAFLQEGPQHQHELTLGRFPFRQTFDGIAVAIDPVRASGNPDRRVESLAVGGINQPQQGHAGDRKAVWTGRRHAVFQGIRGGRFDGRHLEFERRLGEHGRRQQHKENEPGEHHLQGLSLCGESRLRSRAGREGHANELGAGVDLQSGRLRRAAVQAVLLVRNQFKKAFRAAALTPQRQRFRILSRQNTHRTQTSRGGD